MTSTICYFVASVISLANFQGVDNQKLIFGVKQIVETVVADSYILCEGGSPITVEILSIEAPTNGIAIGPFEFKSKKTVVKVKITKDGKEFIGTGTAKTNVKSTLMQLQDENLEFQQTEFSVAVKKAVEDALKPTK